MPATTEIYTYLHTLSLHDALPICPKRNQSFHDFAMTDYSPCTFPVIGANLRYEAHSFPFSSTVAGDHPTASRKCEARFARILANPLYSPHRARARDCDSGPSQILSLKGGDVI